MMQKFRYGFKVLACLGWAIVISLYSVAPTFAKNPASVAQPAKFEQGHLPVLDLKVRNEHVRILSVKVLSADGKLLTTKLSKEQMQQVTAAVTKSLVKARECVDDGFGSCMTGCLRTAGVSPIQLILCGTSCVLWETGVGLIVCAVCIGLDATALTFCGSGCAAYAN
jgi:hypothetical protein